METKKKNAILESTSFEELLNAEYGERGTETREKFEAEAETFCEAYGNSHLIS
ncbi:hypothetical protein SAMN04487900_10950 [Prevotella communis]|uniref:Uncharacterized protein n=1 Tax=Prevotella communis TaxID=2913614 RepID=A0A1H0GL76_9BACT|nr:hypothetical protein [Prevotella communis]SDO07509.1 hypothetical protein SAMN04487900_10950 [Prevotella communis]